MSRRYTQDAHRKRSPMIRIPTPARTLHIGVAVLVALLAVTACGDPTSERLDRKKEEAAWCHQQGGTYIAQVSYHEPEGPHFRTKRYNTCEVPPPSAPTDCYTTAETAPDGAPTDTNWYAYYLLGKGGAGAGGLDEYEHCAQFAVIRPPAETAGTTGK